MASVILPTRTWTASCATLASQLDAEDELLVVCDGPDDPVAAVDLPRNAALVVAGEPEGCSGKANAVAAGLERARQDRIVLTDDDFERGADWLATMKRLGRDHGAASAVPVFVADEGPWLFLEPLYATAGSFALAAADLPWGGGVTFDRRHLDLEAYVRDLRRTVSDDGLLGEYLDDLTTTRELVHLVPVERDWASVYQRVVRFGRIVYLFDRRGSIAWFAVSLAFLAVALAVPLAAATLATGAAFGAYRSLGLDRRTYLLAFPAFLLAPALFVLGVLRREFTWGGRRYRWTGKFDVTVLS